MRISYWSSDVCSSDLVVCSRLGAHDYRDEAMGGCQSCGATRLRQRNQEGLSRIGRNQGVRHGDRQAIDPQGHPHGRPHFARGVLPGSRSEEHTSELQSLMRISYAVFCLKKKITKKAIT